MVSAVKTRRFPFLALLVLPLISSCADTSITFDPFEPNGIYKISTEAAAAQIYRAFDYQWTYEETTNWNETVIHTLLYNYNAQLGSPDFQNLRNPDQDTYVNTVLAAHVIAIQAAVGIYNKETNEVPVVFTIAEIDSDRPMTAAESSGLTGDALTQAQASEQRWSDQVTNIYQRLYSRDPTTEEVSAIRTAFVSIMESLGPGGAWIMTLYALMSTGEFWNV